jgi:hypothetical protein
MKRSSILNTPLPNLSRRAFLSSLSAMTAAGLIEPQLESALLRASSGWNNPVTATPQQLFGGPRRWMEDLREQLWNRLLEIGRGEYAGAK